jgi:hypothetical protein
MESPFILKKSSKRLKVANLTCLAVLYLGTTGVLDAGIIIHISWNKHKQSLIFKALNLILGLRYLIVIATLARDLLLLQSEMLCQPKGHDFFPFKVNFLHRDQPPSVEVPQTVLVVENRVI